jgi:hypothetical protein
MYRGDEQLNETGDDGLVIDFLSHANKPRDRYDVYLYSSTELGDSSGSVGNLFDDSFIEDRKWFETAMTHLSRLK